MMENIEFLNQRISSESFSGKTVSQFSAVESEFVDCSFENMKIKDICFGAGAKQTRYVNCKFDNSVFSSNAAGIARFENCSFNNVKIKKLFCVDVEMVNCIFSGKFAQGNFVGIHRKVDGSCSINEFKGNDFTRLELGDVSFIDIDLSLQKFSSRDDFSLIYDVKSFITKAKIELENLEDSKLFDSASKVITILELQSQGGNNQLFVDKRNFPKNLQDAAGIILSFN